MSLISQRLGLLNGVSQRPQEQRPSSQADLQVNGLSHRVRGLMMRPPVVYLGKLVTDVTGWSTAFVHRINRSLSERYHVIIANGVVQVFDAITLSPVSVLATDSAYLTDTGAGFRATTAGDTTIIVNRGTTVKRGTKKTALPAKYEALVYVRQADYGTTYQVTLNEVVVAIKTVSGDTAGSRVALSTEKIAGDLYTALTTNTILNSLFTFAQYGSTLYITRANALDFTLTTFDGLADKGLKAVKGSIQIFEDLPRRAPNGFVVEVSGDPESDKDNYWVKYDDLKKPSQDGVWRECPRPGTLVKLDPTTMPHRLVRKGEVLNRIEHVGMSDPDANVVNITGTDAGLVSVPWQFTTPDNTAIPANTSATIRDNGTGVKITLVQAVIQRFTATFTIDTSVVDAGNDVTVTIYKNSVSQGTKTFKAGFKLTFPPFMTGGDPIVLTQRVDSFDLAVKCLVNDVIELKITYANGVTPGSFHRAWFTPDNLTVLATAIREIRFASSYPAGAAVTATVDGTPFTYNVGTTPATGVTVAAALAASIDAHANYSAVVMAITTRVQVQNTNTGAYPVITVATNASSTTVFSNPALAMTVNAHAGRTLKNLTDGSSGTINSNTTTSITVAALTGGSENKFNPGDFCSVVGSGAYFVFEPCPWNERGAGDDVTCPFPSFTDNTIKDAVFYQNRLGFASNENIIFSASGDLFNFFRFTAAQLLADDMIDVRSSHAEVSLFDAFVLWNKSLYAKSDNAQWLISGEPALTPTTVRIDAVSKVLNSPGIPVILGSRMCLFRGMGGFTQVQEFEAVPNSSEPQLDFTDLTEDNPQFVKGNPLMMVGDESLGLLAVLTDGDNQRTLYIYSYAWQGDQRAQSSWSKWTLASGQIVGLDLVDGQLGVLTKHADGAYFHTIDLNVALATIAANESVRYLDRRVTQATTGVSSAFAGGNTTWTLPFTVATDGTEGTLVVANSATNVVYTSTRPAANQIRVAGIDLTGASVYIGVSYEFRYRFSRIFFRMTNDVPETRGRLILRNIDIHYRDTTNFTVVVTLDGRPTPWTYTVALATAGTDKVSIPIQARNLYVTVELVNSTPGGCAFSNADWEGDFSTRSRRI